MKDKLSIQCSTEAEEKKHILEIYKRNSITVAARVLNLIREDVDNLENPLLKVIPGENMLVQRCDETDKEFIARIKKHPYVDGVQELPRIKRIDK